VEHSETVANYDRITRKQQETWATGDFHEVARQNVCMAEALCEAVDPRATDRVLDVACGSGTAALVAARRYCDVVGIDYVPALVERARAQAEASGLGAEFRVADAQALPFDDNSFDCILSVYGVQFAPDQEQAAREMLRVCRPGGVIGLATPISEGWSGDFFAVNARHAPPPPGVQPPLRWGTDEGLEALLGPGTTSIESAERVALQYYRSVDHAVSVFTSFFGPAVRASRRLDEAGRRELAEDLRRVFEKYNRATDGTAVIENRYRLTVATCADAS
jgi:ubiquinone/menaquinone biosynthesis C-methylase UbiE